jgi:DNA (cytosine-5)-methyltransferase 1
MRIKQATKNGWIDVVEGGVADLSYPNSKTRRGRVQGGGEICPTLQTKQEVCRLERYRIRKLTPTECGRLMNVEEQDINNMLDAESNSQCYKAFGNSIVVSVLMGVFSQLGIKGVKKWNDMSDDEIYNTIYQGCTIYEKESED